MRALLLLALVGATVFASEPTLSDRVVELSQAKVRVREGGRGPALVVFVSGLGEDLETWAKVQPAVAAFARTLSYDRPGLGRSTSASTPRDVGSLASELADLLAATDNTYPAILVGHSLGGAIIRLYAAAHPAHVAGVVFVDPEDSRLTERLQKALPAGLWAARERALAAGTAGMPPGVRAEYDAFPRSGELISAARPFPAVRVVMLSGTKKNPAFAGNPEEQDLKLAIHREDLAHYSKASHVLVPESRHYIQLDAPATVISAIEQLCRDTVPVRQ